MEHGVLKVPKKIDTRVIDRSFFREARDEGVICYEPCGGLCAGLEVLLRCGVKVNRYLYQDTSPTSQAVARTRSLVLSRRHPDLLPTTTIQLEQLSPDLESDKLEDLVQAGALNGERQVCSFHLTQRVEASQGGVHGPEASPRCQRGGRTDASAATTILATQNSRAFQAPRAGTVIKSDDFAEEGETREVNLDEKAIAMGYSADELRRTDGVDDEKLAEVLGLDMDRRAMEMLFVVAEASTTRLPWCKDGPSWVKPGACAGE
ncbi:hypothetical protein CYMTET_56612 [Cymbomonas tetramitiformis]|uniref:Uncharacterized protein n=1 Tax=Cymbomonas tetramitiformis TaxID=36881 RepID=A0AAE0BCB9_9CHLO|nr:hypothetical protein CYMTET_56612 [Cymbomonas tetramitiformis]